MAKFHLSKDGTPRACNAKVACPLGGPDAHYDSPETARAAYESQHQAQTFSEPWKSGELSDDRANEAPVWNSGPAFPYMAMEQAQEQASAEDREVAKTLDYDAQRSYWDARRGYMSHEDALTFADEWDAYAEDAQATFAVTQDQADWPDGEKYEAMLQNHRIATGQKPR